MKKFLADEHKMKIVLTIIMSFSTYYTLCISSIIKTYDILSWLTFLTIIILFYKTNIFNKEMKKEIIVLSLLFSFLLILGENANALQYSKDVGVLRQLISYISFIKLIGYFNIIFIILTNIIPKIYSYTLKKEQNKKMASWKIFIIALSIFLIGWLPYFLCFYPGTLSPDSFSELKTIINGFSNVSDHHPVMHIIFISIPYNIGIKIFGNMSSAIATVTVTQMVVLASIFSSMIVFLYKRNVNNIILIIITGLLAFLPVNGFYSIVMWKDVLFGGSLLLLTMQTIKILEKDKINKLNLRNIVGFILTSLFCIFFRNNAIYMYFIFAIATFIILRKHYKTFLCAFIIIFGTYFLVKGPIFNYFDVKKSSSAEYIGMPLQQIGRMAFKNVPFTKNEKKLLDKLIPVEIMEGAYNPKVSDGIKFNKNYNSDVFDMNKAEYLKLWLKLVIKYPTIAIEAYSISTLGYWYPGVEYWSVANNIWENDYNLQTETKLPQGVKEELLKLESRQTPILNIEWSIGLYFWIILIMAIISYKKNKIKGIYPYIPAFGIWLTMMIASPVFGEFRYIYGVVISTPLLILVPFLLQKEKIYKKQI